MGNMCVIPFATQAETIFEQMRKFDKGGLPFSSLPPSIFFSAVSKDRVRRRPSGVSTLARLAGGAELDEEELDEEELDDDEDDDELEEEKLTFLLLPGATNFLFALTSTSSSLSLSEDDESEEEDDDEEDELDSTFFLFLAMVGDVVVLAVRGNKVWREILHTEPANFFSVHNLFPRTPGQEPYRRPQAKQAAPSPHLR